MNAPDTAMENTATPAVDLVDRLRAASNEDLVQILAAADVADIAQHHPGPAVATDVARPASGTVEIVLLGALGCRYGMLAGGAGGHLVRTESTTVLVDPGPAALGLLVDLSTQGQFSWGELDAVVVTHFHPDHYVDVIPCIEGMVSHATTCTRKLLVANPTTVERFTAFSPYHAGGMVDVITLAHRTTDGHGDPSVKVGDLTIYATPALHIEETGRTRSALGLAYATAAGGVWYTSDTNLTDDLSAAVAAVLAGVAVVIAHADASNIHPSPDRAAACHLETRDVPTITGALHPHDVVIQHYDAAYSTAEYRIAQAVWLQRHLDDLGHDTRIWPAVNGLHLTIRGGRIRKFAIHSEDAIANAIADYLRS